MVAVAADEAGIDQRGGAAGAGTGAVPVIVPPDWLVSRAPAVSTTPVAAPVMRPALISVPLSVSVPESVSVMPAARVLLPLNVQFAPGSMVTPAKPTYFVPRPLSVPADAPKASSIVVVPMPLAVPMTWMVPSGDSVTGPLPLTLPTKTAPGSMISRLVPPPKMTASDAGAPPIIIRRQGAAVGDGVVHRRVDGDVVRDQRVGAQVADAARAAEADAKVDVPDLG